MSLPKAREFWSYVSQPPISSQTGADTWNDEASPSLLLEALGRHSALKKVGIARMNGSTQHINTLWIHYRNFIRQAISNFEAALGVGNRSSSLLYYYAMLNFAKAELLDQHHSRIVDQRIGHGLSFDPVQAKSVAGDSLKVTTGMFPLLYERRTGRKLPPGTQLPLKRLLCAIPEIGSQLNDSGIARTTHTSIDVVLAVAPGECWILLRIDPYFMSQPSLTKDQILKYFREVEAPEKWREIFSISKRLVRHSRFLESKRIINGDPPQKDDVIGIMDDISDVFDATGYLESDAIITPYLYKTQKFLMPPSLARYAVTFYASSLVRYRPTAFDADKSPEQAYLFDALARECAIPMLVDTLTQLEGRPQIFFPKGSLRV